jgi:hypothetical protein
MTGKEVKKDVKENLKAEFNNKQITNEEIAEIEEDDEERDLASYTDEELKK